MMQGTNFTPRPTGGVVRPYDPLMAGSWRAAGLWPGTILSDRFFELAAKHPAREFVVDPIFGRLTRGEAAAGVTRLMHGLRASGIGPGSVAIICLPNWTPFVVLHLALTAIGAVTVNVPPVYRERELEHLAKFTDAQLLALPAEFRGYDYLPMARALAAKSTALRTLFLVGPGADRAETGMLSYEAFMNIAWETRGAPEDLTLLRPAPDAVTAIGFTSGTTGVLKGALQTSNILSAMNEGFIRRYGLNEEDTIFAASPLGHAVGFTHCLRLAVNIGARLVLLDRWDAAQAAALIASERCTFTAAATPFLVDLVGTPALAQYGQLPSLRLFLCGGAPVPAGLVHAARKVLPHTFVSPLFGMTECGGVSTCPPDAPLEKRWLTDGKPCEGMEVRVVDAAGQPVATGTDGELVIRGAMLALEYFHQPELTAEHWRPDGFFRSGDQARLDADGYVKITGRIKDLIIRGGVNIAPAEIENVLFEHPAVAGIAVVGMPDARLGERICAFVVPRGGASIDVAEIQRWMERAGIAKQKWPEAVRLVDALPLTPSGKVQKFRLRELLAKG